MIQAQSIFRIDCITGELIFPDWTRSVCGLIMAEICMPNPLFFFMLEADAGNVNGSSGSLNESILQLSIVE